MKSTLIAAALAFTSLTAIAPAQADDWSQRVPQIDVPYGDLNLSNPAGAQVMLRRIKSAASKVCGGYPYPAAGTVLRYRRCVRTATDGAVAQLNAPLVTALHTGRPITDPRFAQDGAKSR